MEIHDQRVDDLAQKLAAAHKGQHVDAGLFTEVTFEEAFLIQTRVLALLKDDAPISKIAIGADGRPTAAPIFGSLVLANGGSMQIQPYGLIGLEVEVAVKLRTDLTPEIAAKGEADVLDAIETFLIGVELVGTRLTDRTKAGLFGPLADSMVTAGYVIGGSISAEAAMTVAGLPVTLAHEGKELFAGPGKPPFGGALSVLRAYASQPVDHFNGLRAGQIVTTGSLCGLVAFASPGRVTARVGDFEAVTFSLV